MRAEVAAANGESIFYKTQAEAGNALAGKLRQEADELRRLLGEFTARVGRYAIAAGVPCSFESRNLDLSRMPNFRMQVPMSVPATFGHGPVDAVAVICDEVMAVLDVAPVEKSMSSDMHCRLTFDGMPVGYAISRHALRHLTRDELVYRIAPEIAGFLEAELRAKGWRP
jgi:hypothetical protein